MKIIVLSTSKYKEKDLIVNAISEDQVISFKARGGLEAKSPFAFLSNELTVAEVEFSGPETYKNRILKSAMMISSPLQYSDSLDKLFTIKIVSEITNKASFDEENNEAYIYYPEIIKFLTGLSFEHFNPYVFTMIYLSKALKMLGNGLVVDKCVRCGGTKDIVAFSFDEGGFICKNCYDPNIDNNDLNVNQMKLIRFASSVPDYSYPFNYEISEGECKALLEKMADFCNDIVGLRIENLKLLTQK